ncbi:tripartite tricarboxylate transporter TctB family protein [Actinophytocola sp.]|uniref:tripartite tricarboxylate transporter TctB family protein n=1 Tax=Actinophytocola sp. TaxID=1872138 RepID=UPI003D6C2EE0
MPDEPRPPGARDEQATRGASIDLVPGTFFVIVGVSLFVGAQTIRDTGMLSGTGAVGPATMPRALGILLAAVGIAVLGRGFAAYGRRRRKGAAQVRDTEKIGTAETGESETADTAPIGTVARGRWYSVATAIPFVLLLPYLGYLVTAPLFLLALTRATARSNQWLRFVVFSLLCSAICYAVFVLFLGYDIPLWPYFVSQWR